ncbi:Arginyl-tRNA synthetase [Tyrophagus putrescentiae]|nr:Arginyl-tRNA synthetase [Tyrophagus putrescentiae]
MASVKREILFQLKRVGLHFEKSTIRVLPPSTVEDVAGKNELGRTFAIEMPANEGLKIKDSLLKELRSRSPFIDNVYQSSNSVDCGASRILFQINFEHLIKELFADLGAISNDCSSQAKDNIDEDFRKTIIVEYSSPNIAKPFHVGNLRSAIIGNCVANVLQFRGHNVIRMNYLGDWGTQFGILSLAYDRFGSESLLQAEPLKHLFDVYVKGNQEIEKNTEWRDAAKERFTRLESQADPATFEQWARFRELSLQELKSLYQRLGITFDVYSSESMYTRASLNIVEQLKNRGLVEQSEDGALLATTPSFDNPNLPISVPLLKSDGSTLYLTRDLAAAVDRKEQYNFDRMYYVVDSSQAKHFWNLKSILNAMGNNIYRDMKHLKFGRIVGMSTRRGNAIFLDDVLNEAKERALSAIKSSPNTKISPEQYESVADKLGVSAIVVNDLSNRRVREYRFNWDKALRLTGDTGISLQYTHARLCNLELNCGVELSPNCDIDVAAIDTAEGRMLINLLAMFDQVIERTAEELEPSLLAHYLFDLKSAINRANQELTVKGESPSVAQTRLQLFRCAQRVFSQSMRLLGLTPLQAI